MGMADKVTPRNNVVRSVTTINNASVPPEILGRNMNKKIASKLNELKIYNDWGIAKDGHPYIFIRRPSRRDVTPDAVVLSLKGRAFKDTAWYQNGSLWFTIHIGGKEEGLRKAFDWVEKHFPGKKMVMSPFSKSAWVFEDDLKAALEAYEIEKEKALVQAAKNLEEHCQEHCDKDCEKCPDFEEDNGQKGSN